MSPELLAAQMVGRWKSGAPVELSPVKDDLSLAEGTPRENDFEFGDDREGVRCPWASKVRLWRGQSMWVRGWPGRVDIASNRRSSRCRQCQKLRGTNTSEYNC